MQDPTAVRPTAIERVPVKSLSALFGGLCAFGVADQAEANPGAQGPAGPPSAKKNADGPKAKAACRSGEPACRGAPARRGSAGAAQPPAAAPQPARRSSAACRPAARASAPGRAAAGPTAARDPGAPARHRLSRNRPRARARYARRAGEDRSRTRAQGARRSSTKRKRPRARCPTRRRARRPPPHPAAAATPQQVKRAQRRLRRALPKRYARSYRRAAKKYDLGPEGLVLSRRDGLHVLRPRAHLAAGREARLQHATAAAPGRCSSCRRPGSSSAWTPTATAARARTSARTPSTAPRSSSARSGATDASGARRCTTRTPRRVRRATPWTRPPACAARRGTCATPVRRCR